MKENRIRHCFQEAVCNDSVVLPLKEEKDFHFILMEIGKGLQSPRDAELKRCVSVVVQILQYP